MALRSRLAGTVEIELLALARGFGHRPIVIDEPFGLGEVLRLELVRIAADHGAQLHRGALAEVDAAERVVRTLELADAKARRGPDSFATERFDAVEDAAGSLPWARPAQREEWAHRRVCAGQ